ncbi:MAG: TetR/AcrR family transcriptional regulator [Nevskiales bacterium]
MKTTEPGSSRRGRPARSPKQAQASRQRVLQAARRLFAEQGYEGVSMRKIASLAGCSPASLYTLFPNKRQLLRNLWEIAFEDLMEQLESCYQSTPDSARLEALCVTFIDFWLERQDDYREIFLIEDRLQDAGDSYFVDSSEAIPRLSIIRHAVSEAQARGEIGPGDPGEIQNILLCTLQGVALSLITIPEYAWGNPGQLKLATIRTMLKGLANTQIVGGAAI